jgi:glycosyltransferase involved in cell wall biosynthesis
VALHPIEQAAPYPIEVHHRVRRDVLPDYVQAARALERCVDVVSIQHEFGIWGGQDGSYVLDFIRELRVPAVTTLHTVPGDPTPNQLALLTELVARSESTVVMSTSAAALLAGTYGAEASRLDVIPHGVPDLPFVDADTVKAGLEMAGRVVILSFGLLGPDKGYELALDALPAIVAKHPTACYVIVGATRPDLLRVEGEAYRERLVARVARLKLQKHVRFLNRFVGRVELIRWLQAADVFVTPYPQPDLSVAGTLAYAMGAGRAVVSTPFAYAAELLADGRGTLVPHGSPRDLAAGVNALLGDPDLRAATGRRAHEYSRSMVWSAVGAEYRRVLASAAANPPMLQPLAPWSAITV